MQNFDPRNRSQCPIEAADNALRLLQLLREGGKLRLKDAAAELGFAPSTAHHLLAMLVYRGFVVQDEFKNYVPSVAIGVGPARLGWSLKLRDLARPHTELLAANHGNLSNTRAVAVTGSLSKIPGWAAGRGTITNTHSPRLDLGWLQSEDRLALGPPTHHCGGGALCAGNITEPAILNFLVLHSSQNGCHPHAPL